MTARATVALDDRVVLLAPTARDEGITTAFLRDAGVQVTPCRRLHDALLEVARGAAALALPEELLTPHGQASLVRLLREQPPWSDLPVLVLTRTGANSDASIEAVQTLGNVTLLERPLRLSTFLSAVRTALRARRRQYEIRGHLEEHARSEAALRAADRRKDEFLATLGHELRNPLAPLLTGLHLMRMSCPDDERVLRVMATMERQIAHLGRLVDDLLEMSRITRGLVEVRHDPLDLGMVLEAAVDTSRPVIDAGGHDLVLDVAATAMPVRGDAVRLTQVFANLLTNAAKYTNAGGRIDLVARVEDGHAVVTVRDNGIGIPPAHLHAVFEMFMQVDRSTRSAQGGLGIGLTLVRSLVELHGGRVEARSEGPGRGSEFLVRLPLAATADDAPALDTAPSTFPRRRILVVDDNRDAGETLAALLETLGATVAVAHSGRAAIAKVDEFSPDAILLDIGMPDMDGYEVARRLRAMPRHAGTMVIALTGWGQDEDLRQSREAGIDHHMVKPPDLTVLRDLLVQA